jgi:ERCC4-type nuclease
MCLEIVIDDRDRNAELINTLTQFREVKLTRKRLPTGDFIVGDRLLFERKTVKDFAISLIDGRLFNQAKRMAQSHLRPAWILEGDAQSWRSLNIRREAIQGALINLMLIYDLPVLRATRPAETAHLLLYTGRQIQRALLGGTTICKRYGIAKSPQSRRLRVLQSLPGVGPKRAKALLQTFGSIRGCINASNEELLKVHGMGSALAERICKTVEEPPVYYG